MLTNPMLVNATEMENVKCNESINIQVPQGGTSNSHEEWPLGKLFLPSVMMSAFPVHNISGLETPSGKHLQKKSGLGRPRETSNT